MARVAFLLTTCHEFEGVKVLSSGDLLGDAILRIHQGRSVSKLFPV